MTDDPEDICFTVKLKSLQKSAKMYELNKEQQEFMKH